MDDIFDVNVVDFNEFVDESWIIVFFMGMCEIFHRSKPFSLVNISSIYGVVTPKFHIYRIRR